MGAMVCPGALVVVVLCTMPHVAAAEDLYERLWPEAPNSTRLTLSQQITDQLTELGNVVGSHVTVLSNETIALNFDGRRRRARIRLGLTDDGNRYLTFKLASDVHFTQGMARFSTQIEVGVAGRVLHLELPDVEMAPSEYHGERGVMVRVPLFKRTF
jgi:hypothetical protein